MNQIENMEAIDIARRLAELGQGREACRAYSLAIARTEDPAIQLEAALYILENDGSYQVAYEALLEVHQQPEFQEAAKAILTEAFYLPNEKQLKSRYKRNCKLLQDYPYLFRKDFPQFEELPIRFYPFDDDHYVPYDREQYTFGKKVNFHFSRVTHHFFKNLDDPILAHDIYSQYELEYLRDNVRPSEDICKDNHIYLHYSSWMEFCAHLQVWNLRDVLDSKKFVFLIEEEQSRYPIDFKSEYGIDYTQFPLQGFSPADIKKIIWHTQLSAHNGGDFFNEVLDDHPNLITTSSIMFDSIDEQICNVRKLFEKQDYLDVKFRSEDDKKIKLDMLSRIDPASVNDDRILFICVVLIDAEVGHLDLTSRIMPAIMFQPHFHRMDYVLTPKRSDRITMSCKSYDAIQNFSVFRHFPYFKTFTPMRRPTTSGAASLRFQKGVREWEKQSAQERSEEYTPTVASDMVVDRVFNRSYMVDAQDPLFRDSVLVRFEDGKTNPRATFTALAEFLDIPYTRSMTYCSLYGQQDPESLPGNARGLDLRTVYSTYDEFLGKPERTLIEYFMRDTYARYGYDFQYYDGTPMDPEKIEDLLRHMDVMLGQIWDTYLDFYREDIRKHERDTGEKSMTIMEVENVTLENVDSLKETFVEEVVANRKKIFTYMLNKLYFVNEQGQPLQFMPLLQLDPELMENPMYH